MTENGHDPRDDADRHCSRLVQGLGLLALGCAPHLNVGGTETIHDIQITTAASPVNVFAHIGEEIRWHHLTCKPIAVGLLESKWLDGVTCENGFRSFGRIDDIVTVKPGQYGSLCFSRKGTVQYNVWLDTDNLPGSMTPTGTVHVREASSHSE